ncbi:MACPF domain-containing protein [Caerostris extrusa]|uniref:MACPF domain-containing protein n=1 Tax=Caerostris extrusa TaxID=172846 RepID=A0AAV4X827_CAEEX|nr:MACPF domain-containing protein [Caerostris extrusa]
MSNVLLYAIPALLGRAYNMKNDTIGPDLFKIEDTKNAKVIHRYMTNSEYKIVSQLSEASDFLDVDGKMAIKLKIGATKVEGEGSYLKVTSSLRHKVDILVKVVYETVTETIPASIEPRKDWEESLKGTDSTHYVRSITYGGTLLGIVRFNAETDADKAVIKALCEAEMSSKSGSFEVALWVS